MSERIISNRSGGRSIIAGVKEAVRISLLTSETPTAPGQSYPPYLAESNFDHPLVDLFHDFASDRLLYWIEGLSLLDDIDLGISGLGIVIKVLMVCPRLYGCEGKVNTHPPAFPRGTRSGYCAAIRCPLVFGTFRRHAFNICDVHLYCCTTADTCNDKTASAVCIEVREHGITLDIEVGCTASNTYN